LSGRSAARHLDLIAPQDQAHTADREPAASRRHLEFFATPIAGIAGAAP
jgi:hypothetical protein